jgi:hypothetical protein
MQVLRLILPIFLASAAGSAAEPPAAARFAVVINGYSYDWASIGRFVLPGETLRLAVDGAPAYSGWVASGGELVDIGGQTCWVAPAEPGLHPLICTSGPALKTINAFVMIPYRELDRKGYLRGYHVGSYPASNPFPNFGLPRGFIEVTPNLLDVRVSDRHTLRDFAPRDGDGWPKYMVLREELLIKLEGFTDFLCDRGYPCDRLTVFSGYRSPFHNRRNRSGRNSAHVYGGAADFYLDRDGNGRLDDLNRDGVVNRRDAKLLSELVDEFEAAQPQMVGGCGYYGGKSSRSPFVHIDTRGERTRWHQ